MKTYDVTIYEKLVHTITVEADNEETAVSSAYKFYLDDREKFGIIDYETESDGFTGHDITENN